MTIACNSDCNHIRPGISRHFVCNAVSTLFFSQLKFLDHDQSTAVPRLVRNALAAAQLVLPLTAPCRYVSADGACWTHLLLWIAKDLAWLQCWLWASTGFAIVGCSLSLFMIFRNIRTSEWLCAVSEVGVLVWLYGNAEWMYGECHDFTYKVTDPDLALDDHTTAESALVLWAAGAIFAALCIIRFFRRRWCFRRQHTLRLVSGNDNDIDELQPHGWMRCVFREWSDYEEFHNLTWLCCDLSWNLLNAGFWWPAAALTLCIACDTTAVSSRSRDGSVDTAHYFFQMLWVLSNSLWVYGDLYTNQDNQDPEIIISILAPTRDALSNFRFLSSVACLFALLMGVIFHLYWAWISLARSIFVPTRIQFLLSLEDDGMSLQT